MTKTLAKIGYWLALIACAPIVAFFLYQIYEIFIHPSAFKYLLYPTIALIPHYLLWFITIPASIMSVILAIISLLTPGEPEQIENKRNLAPKTILIGVACLLVSLLLTYIGVFSVNYPSHPDKCITSTGFGIHSCEEFNGTYFQAKIVKYAESIGDFKVTSIQTEDCSVEPIIMAPQTFEVNQVYSINITCPSGWRKLRTALVIEADYIPINKTFPKEFSLEYASYRR